MHSGVGTMAKLKITYVLKAARVEVHEGILEGSRVSEYYHPDCDINVIGTLKGSCCNRAQVSHALMQKMEEFNIGGGRIRDSGYCRKRPSREASRVKKQATVGMRQEKLL